VRGRLRGVLPDDDAAQRGEALGGKALPSGNTAVVTRSIFFLGSFKLWRRLVRERFRTP
jgi:hypothetical protein